LACNTIGVGRMIDPPLVVEAALPLLDARKDFEGRRVVITSGGTREPIDPVRFIGNRSSGKMGRALTMEALARKANVTLVTANAETDPPAAAEVIEVETAREMQDALMARLHGADVVIGAAAVADYRAEQQSPTKHKRSGDSLTLALVENPDIIAGAARERQPGQVMVGFAAETDNLLEQGQKKLHAKGLDLILANAVGADSGFGADSLEAALIGRDGVTELGSLSKEEVAEKLFDRIASLLPDAG
jgi:phosphopantothenoylcysteine decarboxylase/phosphopantothenate--cysteine ligase